MGPTSPVDIVRRYLRGQNLEQLGRIEDAIAEYEAAVEAAFDSTGPYDRLIALYGNRAEHHEVIRVTDAALSAVRTAPEKIETYKAINAAARKALGDVPTAAKKTGR